MASRRGSASASAPAPAPTAAPAAQVALLTLAALVAAGSDGLFAPEAAGAELVKAGHAEMHPTATDAQGNRAFRVTEAGVAAHNAASAPAESGKAGSGKQTVQFHVASKPVPLPPAPERKTPVGGGREELYPFASLEVGGAFFVPGKTAKNLASTVSGARARYAEVIEGQTRKNRAGKDVPATKLTRDFAVRDVADGGIFDDKYKGVSGAGVWRVALTEGATVEGDGANQSGESAPAA